MTGSERVLERADARRIDPRLAPVRPEEGNVRHPAQRQHGNDSCDDGGGVHG
jgi:hypothetical protein